MQDNDTKIPLNLNLHPDAVLAAEKIAITTPMRFWQKVNKTDSCWLWTGALVRGIPTVERGLRGGTMTARRFSYLLHFGAVPQGKRLIDTCGNPLCVFPGHMKFGKSEPLGLSEWNVARAQALSEVAVDDPSGQDPTLPPGFSKTFRQRFFEKVQKTSSCWVWTGAINSNGYGWIGKGKNDAGTVAAHIASWIIHFGPVPDGLDVLHDCPGGDNPACVCPQHLWTGTASDNAIDAVEKIHAEGKAHWHSTISPETVRAIRDESRNGIEQKVIAEKYGISQPHVSRIISGDRHTRIV